MPDLTDWDLVCFAAEYLGMMVNVHPWLEEDAKHICSLVYTAHYLTPDVDVTSGLERRSSEGSESVDPQEARRPDGSQEGHGDRIVRPRVSIGGVDQDIGV